MSCKRPAAAKELVIKSVNKKPATKAATPAIKRPSGTPLLHSAADSPTDVHPTMGMVWSRPKAFHIAGSNASLCNGALKLEPPNDDLNWTGKEYLRCGTCGTLFLHDNKDNETFFCGEVIPTSKK